MMLLVVLEVNWKKKRKKERKWEGIFL